MNTIENSVATPQNSTAEAVQYFPATSVSDPRFKGKKVAFRDSNGKYHCYSDSEKWAGSVLGQKVNIEEEKLTTIPQIMRSLLDSKATDFRSLYEELQQVYDVQEEEIDFEALKQDLIDAKSKPEIVATPAKFRLTDRQIQQLQDYHGQTGKNATKIFEELGKLPDGKDVLPITTISKWIKKVAKGITDKVKKADQTNQES